tara:strand:+ start:337 stop:1002 length:666 start_codon:yes stop_codon:yes gene_type:complete
MDKIVVIAPHPDDETLGCGGTILKHIDNGDEVHWLICTEVDSDFGWTADQIKRRNEEIKNVSQTFGFTSVIELRLPSTKIDLIPIRDLVEKISKPLHVIEPNILFIPWFMDVHSDHQIISNSFQAFYKWFRYPFIKKAYMYEVLSETEYGQLGKATFKPNVFVDINTYLEKKISIMKNYKSEISEFPFPRSVRAIESLAFLRGSQSGFKAAEAFELIFERK